jgi:hypothetical protein
VIPDRKVYVNKGFKAFLKNRKYFQSKPEVGTHFFETKKLDFIRKATSIVHFLPLNGGCNDFK